MKSTLDASYLIAVYSKKSFWFDSNNLRLLTANSVSEPNGRPLSEGLYG